MATYTDKIQRIIKSIESRTNLSNLIPGAKAYQFIESVSYEAMQLEFKIDNYVSSVSLLTATGNKLDRIGKNFLGISRLTSIEPYVSESMKSIKFFVLSGTFGDINQSVDGSPMDIIIPEGTLINGYVNERVVRFRVTKNTTLGKDESFVFVSAEFVQGTVANLPVGSLKEHSFKNYTKSLTNSLKVTNSMPIHSGREEEIDENYRFRLVNGQRSFPKTTYAGIYDTIIKTPGVSNAFLEQASNGGGTFTVFVQGITAITSDEVIADVEDRLAEVVGPWVKYNVLKPNYIGLTMSIKLNTFGSIKNEAAVLAKIKDSIANYVNNFYGSFFSVSSLLKVASSSHESIANATFDYVYMYTGSGDIRGFKDLNLAVDANPELVLSDKEKLIIETIQNPILITVN